MTINAGAVKFIAFASLFLIQFVATDARAQAIADNMSCQQAVNYYERNGRISKVAHGRTVVPRYDGVAVSKRRQLKCSSIGIKFKTTDNARCVVAYKCRPRSGR